MWINEGPLYWVECIDFGGLRRQVSPSSSTLLVGAKDSGITENSFRDSIVITRLLLLCMSANHWLCADRFAVEECSSCEGQRNRQVQGILLC